VVPAVALLDAAGGQARVMVIDPQGRAQPREVRTGIESGQQVQIISGLTAGEEVVTQGAYGLPEKSKVKIEVPEKEAPEKPSPRKGPARRGSREED
jgi:Cu(I)/Ag(I) efflux system membrane fusion protein